MRIADATTSSVSMIRTRRNPYDSVPTRTRRPRSPYDSVPTPTRRPRNPIARVGMSAVELIIWVIIMAILFVVMLVLLRSVAK